MPDMPKENKPPIFIRIAEEVEECKPYIDDLMNKMKEAAENEDFFKSPCTEPFASTIHADLWVNNTMQKIENGKIKKNKLIDFQMYRYGNPIVDIIFFLFSSVQKQVVKDNFDNLIALYEETFFDVLEDLKCDTSSLQRNFLEQAHKDAHSELIHLLFMSLPVFGRKEESILDLDADPMDMVKESSVTEAAKEHICFVISEFGRRGWIKG